MRFGERAYSLLNRFGRLYGEVSAGVCASRRDLLPLTADTESVLITKRSNALAGRLEQGALELELR
jgi:hypothetical protein